MPEKLPTSSDIAKMLFSARAHKKYEFGSLWEEDSEWKFKNYLTGEIKSIPLISFADVLAGCSIDGWLIIHINFDGWCAYMQREVLS